MLTRCSFRMIPLAVIIVIMIISSMFSASSSSSIVTVMADRHESLPCHEDNTETTNQITSAFGTYLFVFSNPANKQIIQTPKWSTGAWTWIITPDSLKWFMFLHLGSGRILGFAKKFGMRVLNLSQMAAIPWELTTSFMFLGGYNL